MADEAINSRRQGILAAARKAFDANGYAATTMDAIAAEAGVAKGSLYNYFPSKQDLFTQLFTEVIAGEIAGAGELARSTAPARQKLEAILDYWFGRLEQTQAIGRLMLEYWAAAAREQRGELAPMFQQIYGQARELMTQVLTEGRDAGEFSLQYDPAVGASLIIAALDGIQVQLILDTGIRVDHDVVAAFKRGLFNALTAGQASDNLQQPGEVQ